MIIDRAFGMTIRLGNTSMGEATFRIVERVTD